MPTIETHDSLQLGLLVQAVTDYAIFLLDTGGHVVTWNPGAQRLKGYSPEEIIGTHFSIFYSPGEHQKPDRELAEAATTGRVEDNGWRVKKDGTMFWAYVIITAIRDEFGVLTGFGKITRDMTNFREAQEKERRLFEAKEFAIMQTALDCIIVMNHEGKVVEFNPAAELTFGYSRDQVIGKSLELIVPPKYREQHRQGMVHYLATGEAPVLGQRLELTALRADGEEFPIELAITLTPNSEPPLFTSYIRDISGRKRAEQQLRLLSRAVEVATQGVFVTHLENDDFRIVYANDSFLSMTGYSLQEVLGKPNDILYGPKTDQSKVAEIAESIRQGRQWAGEIICYRKNDAAFYNSLTMFPILDGSGTVSDFVTMQTDTTERRMLEEQIRQKLKMESIGQLAGGIAHDFNNLLTIIQGYCELLVLENDHCISDREAIKEIGQAGIRASELTRQLLYFSRQSVQEFVSIDLNEVVLSMDRMLKRIIGEDISLVSVLDPNISKVQADIGAINQVIMNLCVNARDAMPDGGLLTIETKAVFLDEAYVNTHIEVPSGHYVMLSVSDTGTGMSPEIKSRIFDPFFTTKEQGKGTGLGLSVVHGIILQCNGHIGVYSELGFGTTFKIYLPIADKNTTPVQIAEKQVQLNAGTETLLLVEDEEIVRELAANILRNRGYTVHTAANGVEAVEIAMNFKTEIDMLVTDVVMPQMGGRQLAEYLHPLFPKMKVLFVSGYTDDAVVRHGVLTSTLNYLQKPYTPSMLAGKIREVLSSVD